MTIKNSKRGERNNAMTNEPGSNGAVQTAENENEAYVRTSEMFIQHLSYSIFTKLIKSKLLTKLQNDKLTDN